MSIVHVGPATVGEQRRRPATLFRTILAGTLLSAAAAFAPSPHDAADDGDGDGDDRRRAGAPLEALPTSPS